jgi:hypothetical protein
VTTYYTAGEATWPGSWAASAAQAQNPATPAKAIDINGYINAASIVSGDTVTLLGTYPYTLTDTAQFVGCSIAVTAEIPGGGSNRANDGAHGRNILFGNVSGGTSSLDGINFLAVGDVAGWNVDMRGATVEDERQSAALFLQGRPGIVDGFKIRCADWNYAATGRIAASGTDYVTDMHENCGIIVRGAWGCEIKNCIVDGGTRCGWGIKVQYRASTTGTINANLSILVHDNEAYHCGEGCIEVTGGAGINASGANPMPNGSLIEIYDNLAYDGFWGETSWNAARYHGNLLAVYSGAQKGSRVLVHDNECYGECQDALLVMTGVSLTYDNYVHDVMPGFAAADTVNTMTGVGGGSTLAGYATGWDVRTTTGAGSGIKCGLGQSYYGTPEPAGWLSTPGTPGGTYNIDQLRPFIFRNIVDGFPRTGVNTNGSGGALIFANEIRSSRGNRGISNASAMAAREAIWVANNYVEVASALVIFDFIDCFAFNNIFKGSTNSAAETGANSNVYGSNNLLDGATSGTFLWTNNTSATAAYTWGVGPTVGGNCDGTGAWYGILAARVPRATGFDLAGRRWKQNRLPIGPRQV